MGDSVFAPLKKKKKMEILHQADIRVFLSTVVK